MTPTLRKYHRHVWFFMAGFLPVLFIAAIMVVPEKRLMPEAHKYQPTALPEVLKTASSELFTARLRGDAPTGGRQLEIELLQPLTFPAALVYLTSEENSKPEEGILIGSLASQNIYRFKMGNDIGQQQYVLLFDPIKNTKIQSLKL